MWIKKPRRNPGWRVDKASHVAFFPFNMLYPIVICFAEMLLSVLRVVLFFFFSPLHCLVLFHNSHWNCLIFPFTNLLILFCFRLTGQTHFHLIPSNTISGSKVAYTCPSVSTFCCIMPCSNLIVGWSTQSHLSIVQHLNKINEVLSFYGFLSNEPLWTVNI